MDELEHGVVIVGTGPTYRTLKVPDLLGVTDELIRVGIILPVFSLRDKNRILDRISFKNLNAKYLFAQIFRQDSTEQRNGAA